MGDLPGGGVAAELNHSTSFPEPTPLKIGTENWAAAHRATRDIIRKVRPTSVSEERRKEVVIYVQRLIRSCLGAEVFPYGSVPLKTYLPDGDIDLTAFGVANLEDTLVDDMKTVFEEEEKNAAAEFVVKDVQLIRAEVKLVKCIVQDIVVDISFNQIGGLCTLCFLEQVDRLIGKDHLFKRSIILIKAWCYYESRILGAHHGLISTYALETLVLYIFHLYHSKLDGPLAVLYKFLDYFSKFDWETYCISLNGPIRLSSFPAIVAEMPEDGDRELLLSRDFLRSCINMFSVPSKGSDKNSRGFQLKNLNIIDPLKETNNLGRSVNKGNFYRIRSAFSYGARKLARILLQPQDSIASELHKFFANTMARHGGGQRPDVQDFDQSLIYYRPISPVPIQDAGFCKTDNFDEYFDEYPVPSGDSLSTSGKSFQQPEANHLGAPFFGESDNLTSGLQRLKISTDSSNCQISSPKEIVDVGNMPHYVPHMFFRKSKWHDNSLRDGTLDSDKLDRGENNASSSVRLGSNEEAFANVGSIDETQLIDNDEAGALSRTKDLTCDQKSYPISGDSGHTGLDQGSTSRNQAPETLESSDLTGDYENYFLHLQYGLGCYLNGLGVHSLPMPPIPTPSYQSNGLWDGLLPVSQYKQNGFSHQHHNGFHPSPAVYTVQPVLLPGVSFGWEDAPKPRGTGTYFPNTNIPLQGYRSSPVKGRNQAQTRSPRNNGRSMIFMEPNMLERSSHEPSQHQVPFDKNLIVNSSDSYLSFSPHQNGYLNANGLSIQPEGVVDFEENSRPQKSVSSSPRTPSGMQTSQTALSKEQDRILFRSSYLLKDEDDFPPLSI